MLAPDAGDISMCSGHDSFKTSIIFGGEKEPSILKQIYEDATDPSRIRYLLESSEARSEVVVSPIRAPRNDPAISPRSDKRDRWAPLLVKQAEDFEIILRGRFIDMDAAFRYFDSVTFNSSGKVALLKFMEGCEKIGFRGDSKALFFFLDSNNDGELEVSDFSGWRKNRARAVQVANWAKRQDLLNMSST